MSTNEARPRTLTTFLLIALVVALAAVAPPASSQEEAPDDQPAHATIIDRDGEEVGWVAFEPDGFDGTFVFAEVWDLTPGFHGFHIHGVGECDPAENFTTAGGHFNPEGDDHADHAGDMPVLYVTEDGDGIHVFHTDRFTTTDLLDSVDGTAVIIHADPDNYANIPDRYQSDDADDPGPDAATLATGDAGPREACGEIESGPSPDAVTHPAADSDHGAMALVSGEDIEGLVQFYGLTDGRVAVLAGVAGLPGGFHGFHIHGTGACEPDFGAAGGHFNPGGEPHGDHAGDMPVLHNSGGFAFGAFVTDRFTVEQLLTDEDGTAVIIHADPDNYANIPDRYQSDDADDPGPDAATLATGDAGARLACGVIEPMALVERHAGADRIETAIAASQAQYFQTGSASSVVLTRDDDFADALAGTPLAVSVDGPTLLTPTGELDGRTRAEIDRVLAGSGTVHVLGGTAAVSQSVEDELSDAGYTVVRLEGQNRFETAVAIADELDNPDEVLIVRAHVFVDAVAAGAAAGFIDGAVLLTTDDEPHPTTDAYLVEHDPEEVYAVGGPAARAYPAATDLSGADRWATAVAVAEEFWDDPFTVGIARGDLFPDALTGGVLAAQLGAPMLVTPPDELHPTSESYLCENAGSIGLAQLFGGDHALSPAVELDVWQRITGAGCPS